MTSNPRKLAVLYTHPGSYTRACLRELKETWGWDILAIHYRRSVDVPFAKEPLDGVAECLDRGTFLNARAIARRVVESGARTVLMTGWMDKDYLAAARLLRREGIYVIAGSDTQFNGSIRQLIGMWIAPLYLHSAIDVLWVTGERQRQLAWRLGYRGDRCWTGMYCCDYAPFSAAGMRRKEAGHHFLYVGRYVGVKGLDVLLDAYRRYRSSTRDPWPLHCIGAGPLKPLLAGAEGVTDLGFVQPDELPSRMAAAGAFVLPSRKEPWGVVVQEAAAAGLPLICSDSVGAAVHLLREGVNGFTFANGSSVELAAALGKMAAMSAADRCAMAEMGRALARSYMPSIWARTLVDGVMKAAS